MTPRSSVKISKRRARLVGVIASGMDLRLALRLSNTADLFELRLDCLLDCLDDLRKTISRLPRSLIITVRHPAEGGANGLSSQRRRELLLEFLPHAQYVDVELRSAKALCDVLLRARQKKIGRIISFHDLKNTPSVSALAAKARSARSLNAEIFKVATKTDTSAQLERLLDFFARHDVDLPLSAMGIGKLGALSRLVFARLDSALNYASLGRPIAAGQLSIKQLRSALSASKIK